MLHLDLPLGPTLLPLQGALVAVGDAVVTTQGPANNIHCVQIPSDSPVLRVADSRTSPSCPCGSWCSRSGGGGGGGRRRRRRGGGVVALPHNASDPAHHRGRVQGAGVVVPSDRYRPDVVCLYVILILSNEWLSRSQTDLLLFLMRTR